MRERGKLARLRRKPRRGAESRAQARTRTLSRRDWLEVAAVIAILSMIVACVYKLRDPHFVPIRRVYFEDPMYFDDTATSSARAELKNVVAPRLKGNFFTVDVRAIEQALTRLGWVKSASVRRTWPGTLSIDVQKHTPVARWRQDSALNRAGQIFKPLGRVPAKLPILHGPAGRADELLARYRRMAKTLGSADLEVRALVQDQRRAWHLLLDNDIPVAIGRGDPHARVARFARVYRQVLASRAERIERIDLRYTNGLAVAWKRSADETDPVDETDTRPGATRK